MNNKKQIIENAIVTKVVDGDTFYAEVHGEFFDIKLSTTIKIRMDKIDAPETHGKEKPMGDISANWLDKKLLGKSVTLEIRGKDVYGRYLSMVKLDGENINETMLNQHLAEVYSPLHHNDGIVE